MCRESSVAVCKGGVLNAAQAKILVFVSTGKQVKFLYEAFKKLRPGCPVRSLYGSMKQMKRMAVFYDFAEARFLSVPFLDDGTEGSRAARVGDNSLDS